MIDKSIKKTATSWKQTNSIKKRQEVLSLTFAALLIGLTTKTVVPHLFWSLCFSAPEKVIAREIPSEKSTRTKSRQLRGLNLSFSGPCKKPP